ncbi:MAG: glycosyltransferase [Lachnospiraceae bacterium]|nr:glycosyltransferase [Lachnospiraceae bacterium]
MEENKEYKVSIVTAVYNVEEYLEEMIESIIAQNIGFENVQLILVDDGSKDNSGNICDQYALQYPDNIVVVHKENGGVSSARNEGLKHVKGEYVNFTDADDMLEYNALEVMYEYLKENEEWIDLVAIQFIFFGAKSGGHPLNYKFKKTRLIDLRKEYNCIQLSLSCALIKSECFNNRCFDTELAYAEDAKVVIDILLDKMRYGVARGASYLYRKQEAGGSAIDTGRSKPAYYIPYMERFIMHSLENAKAKRGYIPQFVQYACMYDLQWRLDQYPLVELGVLDSEAEKQYKSLIINALQYINNKIILEQRNLGNNYKMAILSLKEENKGKKEIEACPNDLQICIEDISSASAGSYSMFFEFIYVYSEKIEIEGYIRCFAEFDDIEVIFRSESEEDSFIEYKAELYDREEKSAFCMDEVITRAKGFRFSINRDEMPDDMELQLYLCYQDNHIICKNIMFGKFFPLAKQLKNSYFYQEGILLTYSGSRLKLLKTANRRIIRKHEKNFRKEMLLKRDKRVFRGWIARKSYYMLKPFKRKELWLISDRLTKADDNGEAFFTYMNTIGKNTNIDTYFVLDKESEDYERLRKIGKVVPYHSTKHKILSLLCDKVVSSQADDYVFNRFFNEMYLYKDILYRQKFIFLQHGVIKDDLSRWLAKSGKNIDIFVTTTYMEYQSILQCAYYYDERQVKCTGLPRYDYLYDDTKEKNIITFMPTWRSYLAGNLDVHTDSRILKKGIEDSSYCKMYRQIFSDSRLYEAAEKYHYEINIMLHPTMPVECIEYFNCADSVKILEKNTRYRELFADAKLIVTDYSSTVFDFVYLRKPVIYYQQDADDFFSGKHTYDKGYFDYERDGFGEVEYTAEALVDRIIEYMKNGCKLKDVYRERIEKTFPYNDKNNCKRVYEEIMKL